MESLQENESGFIERSQSTRMVRPLAISDSRRFGRSRWVLGDRAGKTPLSVRAGFWLAALFFTSLLAGSLLWVVPHAEGLLTERVLQRISAAGIETAGLQVDFAWRDGSISGLLEAGTTEDQVRAALSGLDGVREVDLDLGVAPVPTPTTVPATSAAVGPVSVIAQIDVDRITLSGTVLTEVHRIDLVSAAAVAVGASNVTDRLQVSGLGEEAPGADARVASLKTVLSRLSPPTRGRVVLVDESLSSSLSVPTAESRTALEEAFAASGLVGLREFQVEEPTPVLTTDEEVVALQTELDALQAEINQNVVFSSADTNLTAAAKSTLDKVAAAMNRYVKPVVDAEGHTDSLGNPETNRRLSQARAESVVAYLASVGIDENRLAAIGYGPDRPVGDNSSSEGRQENRRVQFMARPGA